MTIVKYKEKCSEIKLDAEAKKNILTEILAKPELVVN